MTEYRSQARSSGIAGGRRRTNLLLIGLLVGFVVPTSGLAQSVANDAAAGSPAMGRWVPTGHLNEPRAGHTATRLLNGKVLVVGGEDRKDIYEPATAELYDPATGIWTVTGTLNGPRFGHAATLLPDGVTRKIPLILVWLVPALAFLPLAYSLMPFWTK